MKLLKRLGASVTNNLWLKILSLVLAFVIWVVVARINNPVGTVSFNNVRVILTNADALESQGKVYQILDHSDTARVTVKAPESVIRSITASDITAVANLSEIRDDGSVPISYSLDRAESIEGDHDLLLLHVEDRASKYVNITYRTVGAVGEGCVLGKVSLDRNRLEVSGPKSDVDRVAYAQVTIDLDDAMKTISADMEITLYDSNGLRVGSDHISKQTDYVTTTVTVLSTKVVPVYGAVMGEPAAGYMFTGDIYIDPEVVTIAGDTSVLNTIPRIMITDPLDIESAKGNIEGTFHLSDYLPGGVTFEDPDFDDEATVTAYIERIAEKTVNVPEGSIELTDLPEGYEAKILEGEEVSVKISGLSNELNAITSASIKGTVEVYSYITAVYGNDFADGDVISIPVRFDLSEHVKAEPVMVKVVLLAENEEEDDD